ncbi:MAG: Peptidyl-tRNA hydrolase [Catillopecten margaritatus gill symbiont]|uniref:Peptidyl-tRNA hydrolase n=1 Tax=Catillopecten margaritatus gill symbiont TaxID=3083288 RepID=A0AAU6PGT8_9GAMM
MAIKLIVGLGNPGKDYQSHRHNVGFWFCDALAHLYTGAFKKESKFFGEVAQVNIAGKTVRLLKPTTYMNASGQSIQSLAKFYQLNADEILVVHDELDLDPGTARLKLSGGHGGHNGLRDTIKALESKDFYRLRLGIGHPGDKSQVADFVLHSPSKVQLEPIQNAMTDALQVIEKIVQGETESAMQTLHTK